MEPERVYLLYGDRPGDLYFIPEDEFAERFIIDRNIARFNVSSSDDPAKWGRYYSYLTKYTLDEARSDINSRDPCSLHVIRIIQFDIS